MTSESSSSFSLIKDGFRPPGPDWFSKLFGFAEGTYLETQRCFKVEGTRLFSRVTGASWEIGAFNTPSLAELRAQVRALPEDQTAHLRGGDGSIRVSVLTGEASALQALPENRHALFQVASQFNCLEFVGPRVTPEDGITAYAFDRTQGPACSVGGGAAAAFRNFMVRVKREDGEERVGQSMDAMIDNLEKVSALLGNGPEGRYYKVVGGYTMATDDGLRELGTALRRVGGAAVKEQLRIGVHSDVQVTSRDWGTRLLEDPDQIITQVLGSACAVSYSRNPWALWAPFSSLVLEASYEATLLAAVLNAVKHASKPGSRRVFLTLLGGGVFGNDLQAICKAIQLAIEALSHFALDVRIVCYREIDPEVLDLLSELGPLAV